MSYATDETTDEVAIQTNASGWVGVRIHPEESDPDARPRLKERPDRDLSDGHVLRGLLPYETVRVVFEGGRFRAERRVVAGKTGTVKFNFPGNYVGDEHDPLSGSVSTVDGATVVVEGTHVSDPEEQ